jgi:hypothetical protein
MSAESEAIGAQRVQSHEEYGCARWKRLRGGGEFRRFLEAEKEERGSGDQKNHCPYGQAKKTRMCPEKRCGRFFLENFWLNILFPGFGDLFQRSFFLVWLASGR